MKREKILVLCSGGFDSIVMLSELIKIENRCVDDIHILFFEYGQHNYIQEYNCARNIVEKYGIPKENTLGISLPLFTWASSSLTDDVENPYSIESQYVPMRNMIFFSYALSYAQSKGCKAIYSAILANGTYSDTNSQFLSDISSLADNVGIEFRFPYAEYDKYGLAGMARILDIKPEDFFSCNTPIDGKPCGQCADCKAIEYITKYYLEDNYPRQIITRNDFNPTPEYRTAYENYTLEEVRMLINNQCNTQCEHCFYGFKDMVGEPLSIDEWKQVISEAAEINPNMNFHFSGKEPLFDDKIFILADYIDELNSKFGTKLTYDMVTNGINVQKYLSDIWSRNFTRVALSVDYEGCTRSFGGTEDVIRTLVSESIPVHCFIVAHNDNISEVCSMVHNLYGLGVKNFFIKDVINIGHGTGMKLLTTSQYSALYDELVNEFSFDNDFKDLEIIYYVKGRHFWKLHDGYDSRLSEDLETWRTSGDESFYDGRFILRPEYTCSRYLSQISVTPDGYVLGCGTELANPKYPEFSSGRLFNDGDLKTLLNKGRKSALSSIEKSVCRNNYVCFHKNS